MKKIICLILAIIAHGCAKAQESLLHTWHAQIIVMDENNQPVPGAEVSITYDLPRKPNGSIAGAQITGVTDANGAFAASHHDGTLGLLFRAQRAGYYQTAVGYEIGLLGQPINPAKLNVAQRLVLKKIGQPIPMYARKVRVEVPKANEPIGFDLMACDWVPPYGKGSQSDFIFRVQRRWVSRRDFDSGVNVTFSNIGDGLISVLILSDQGSQLHMQPVAPSEGYAPQLSRSLNHTPDGGWTNNDKEGQNYYFRIRTVLDTNGSVKSALYGKIYGDFTIDPINSKKSAYIFFQYYLNPEPNSRNVEFDPRKNLFKKLPFLEEVTTP
jgi:hypothetical protein